MTIISDPRTPMHQLRLSTSDAVAFVETLTRDEARSMLMHLLGRDEAGWVAAMREIQRRRAALGRAEGVTR